MTKLCPRGKAAAKRKFKVYPSAYANAYASKICAGKIKDPSGKKRKDWGPKKMNKGGELEKLPNMGDAYRKNNIYLSAEKKSGTYFDSKKTAPFYEKELKSRNPNPKTPKSIRTNKKPKKASKGTIMKVANKLEKASKAHAGQAKTLKSIKLSRGGGAAIRGTNFQGVF